MLYKPEEVKETLRMVAAEHLDIRTVTLGINMLACPSKDPQTIETYVFNRIVELGSNLCVAAKEVEEMFGVPIVNKRVALTPMSLVLEGASEETYVRAAIAMERAAEAIGIDFIAGYSALVHKGATRGDAMLMRSIPEALSATERVCASVNAASTRAGINMESVAVMGGVICEVAKRTPNASGCARLVVLANAPEDNPFVAGAMHGVGEPEAVINVGVSGPGVVLSAIERFKRTESHIDLGMLAETIKRMAYKITRAGELIGREVVARLGPPVVFGVVDLSLAPTPAKGDSVANIIEALGIERTGAAGTTAALLLITDAVKKGGLMASSSVGGFSGAFIPVSEDSGMVDAVRAGALTVEKLEAMTSICSVGLDMVAVPGNVPSETISAIIADELAIGIANNKTTAVRIIPVPGAKPGDTVNLGGLLGELIVMEVRNFDSSRFIRYGGRIPAPLTAMRN